MNSFLLYNIVIVTLTVIHLTSSLCAQTVIGGSIPDSSAILDIQGPYKGVLLPRMTEEQRDSIVNPATGLLIFNITANCLQVNYGTTAAPSWFPLGCKGNLSGLHCDDAIVTGTMQPMKQAIGVSIIIPYSGGNGGQYNGQSVSSTGVSGLTATLTAGTFAIGGGHLTYTVSGIPDSGGKLSFSLEIGDTECNLSMNLCGAYIANGQWKEFMCHNLAAANTEADPFTPSWEIIGGYWQWGWKGPSANQWLNTNTPNFAHGPTSSAVEETNEHAVTNWSSSYTTLWWSDEVKSMSDPCPAGFRVPTNDILNNGVVYHNPINAFGSWTAGTTNYSSGVFIGPGLFLPAAGYRDIDDGRLMDRGSFGSYWTSTATPLVTNAWTMGISGMFGGSAGNQSGNRRSGRSIRCVSE